MMVHNRCCFASPRRVGMLVALFALSGCAGTPTGSPSSHALAVQALAVGAQVAQAPLTPWPTDQWWESYHDPQLNALITRTLSSSPTLRAAQDRALLAQRQADMAHASLLPNSALDASVQRDRFTALQFIPPPWGGSTYWNNTAQVSLSYDLDLWGRQEKIWQGALDDTRAAMARAQQARLELVTAVVRSYVQLALVARLQVYAQDRLAQLEQRAQVARRGYAAGIEAGQTANELETALPPAKAHLEELQTRKLVLQHQIAVLTGAAPGDGESLATPQLALEAAPGLPSRLPAHLVGRRPDLVAQRWAVEASRARIASARAAFYPDINLMAFAGYQAIGFGQWFSNAGSMAGLGPAIDLPLFDGGQRQSQYSARKYEYDLQVEAWNQAVLSALQEVSDQLVLFQSGARQQDLQEVALQQATATTQMAERRFRAGLGNYPQVIEARLQRLQQVEALVQIQAARQESYAGLMRALGGGLLDETAEH